MKKFFLILLIGFAGFISNSSAQTLEDANENILKLMNEIFAQVPEDIPEIDPDLGRIAVYRIETAGSNISAPLRKHFESRLVEILRTLGKPAVVALPDLNTLKISSTDSSFSIINSLPAPDELWRVARKLRVDAYLEGNLAYVPNKALFLDLRLNRTGTNEVLWAKSYSAYEKDMKPPSLNPLNKSINAGLEIFQLEVDSAADSLLSPDFNNKLVQYSVYFGIYQYTTPGSRLRFELRLGASFLSEGVSLTGTSFSKNSFYSVKPGTKMPHPPVSYNFRSMLYSTLIQNKNSQLRDWLSVYFAVTRYFTTKMPDLTGLGVGLRTDLSSHFSFSTGFSMILGSEFSSVDVESTNQSVRMKVNGVQYELFLLQYTF